MIQSDTDFTDEHGFQGPNACKPPENTAVTLETTRAVRAPAAVKQCVAGAGAELVGPSSFSTGGWGAVRQFADWAGRFEHAKLACQVMAGFELLQLKADLGIRQGGDHTSRANPHAADLLKWGDVVRKEAGISWDTAQRWMRMAEASKDRIGQVDGNERLRLLMETPVQEWSREDAYMLHTAVKELTDGRTQTDFMRELGLVGAYQPQHHPRKDKQLSAAEELELRKNLRAEAWGGIELKLEAYGVEFVNDTDLEVDAQIAFLERQVSARKQWRNTPPAKRNPKVIAAFLKE